MRRVGFIVAGALFMQNLDSAIINTSLPQMAASFGVRPVDLSLGITAYVLSMAAFLPVSAYLSDRLGVREVFASAIVVFTLASVACGAARTLPMFAFARIAQGVGGAMMAPVGRALVLSNVRKHELVRAMAIMSWPALMAPVIAPVLGGLITTYASWRWNFLLNAPLGVAAITLVAIFVPRQESNSPRPFDLTGFVLSAAALLCLLYGFERFSAGLTGWNVSAALLAVGVLVSVACFWHFRRAAYPLLDLSALSVETFRFTGVGGGLAVRALISAVPFVLPLLFQVGFGVSAAASGALIMVFFVGNLLTKTMTTAAIRRFGFRTILVTNGCLASLAIGLCALLGSASLTIWSCAILLFAGVTRAMQFTTLSSLQFADISAQQRGAASTLASISQQIATALGIGSSAILMQVVADVHGNGAVGLADIRITLGLVAVASMLTVLATLSLPRNAGDAARGLLLPDGSQLIRSA
jgi:EmrB/QacA subfamily drug resistance transporter